MAKKNSKELAADMKEIRKMQADVSKAWLALQADSVEYAERHGITPYHYEDGLAKMAEGHLASANALTAQKAADTALAEIVKKAKKKTGDGK